MTNRLGADQVRVGRLNRRVTLMAPNSTPDATGFVGRDTMTPIRTIWASVSPMKGQELRESMREVSEMLTVICCHYNAAKDASEGWWIQQTTDLGTVNYDIRAIAQIDQSRKMIEFTCRVVT